MKKSTFLFSVLVVLFIAQLTAYAQITREQIFGTWGLVGFDFKPQNKKGKLTQAEQDTYNKMQAALAKQPKFMKFIFQESGSFRSEPDALNNPNAFWQLKGNILEIIAGNKVVDRYKASISFNGSLVLEAVKSKVAIPILTLAK